MIYNDNTFPLSAQLAGAYLGLGMALGLLAQAVVSALPARLSFQIQLRPELDLYYIRYRSWKTGWLWRYLCLDRAVELLTERGWQKELRDMPYSPSLRVCFRSYPPADKFASLLARTQP